MVVHHDESLDHGGFLLSSRRTAVKNFVEECAPTESWESLAEGVAERVAPTVRARAPGTVGAYVRYTQAVCSERARVSACVDQ